MLLPQKMSVPFFSRRKGDDVEPVTDAQRALDLAEKSALKALVDLFSMTLVIEGNDYVIREPNDRELFRGTRSRAISQLRYLGSDVDIVLEHADAARRVFEVEAAQFDFNDLLAVPLGR